MQSGGVSCIGSALTRRGMYAGIAECAHRPGMTETELIQSTACNKRPSPSQFLLLRASLQARKVHLMRTVPREALATHMRRTDAAVWRAAAAVLDLPAGVGERRATGLPIARGRIPKGSCKRVKGIPKGAYVRWAMQLLSVTVQRGNAEMYRRSGQVNSREQGLRNDIGFIVPVLMS